MQNRSTPKYDPERVAKSHPEAAKMQEEREKEGPYVEEAVQQVVVVIMMEWCDDTVDYDAIMIQ